MFKKQLFIILIMNIHTSFCALDAIYDAGKQLWNIYTDIDKMELPDLHDASAKKTFSDSQTIIQQMETGIDNIDEQLRLIENSMNPTVTLSMLKSWPINAIVFQKVDRFEIFTSRISENYAIFQQCRKMNGSVSPESYVNAESDIFNLRKIVTDDSSSGDLPSAITAFVTIHHEIICNSTQMLTEILNHLLRMIIIAEIKARIMLTFANVHQFIQESGKRRELHSLNMASRMLFEIKFGIYLDIFSMNFSLMDATYWRACDPDTGSWIRDETFYEMEKTFQATLFRYHWYNCKYDSCDDVRIHKSYQCKPAIYDYRSSCGELITDCFYLSAIQACVLKEGPYRFQYVNSTNRGHLGTNFECPKDDGYMIQDGMGWDSTYAACACNCLSTRNKISLSMIESKVKLNRVIVGLRFVRRNRILHIQPREARLDANGYIYRHAQSWINIPTNIEPSLIDRIDKENRVFFLDDLRLPPSYVLTGVKFNKVTRGTVTGYAIEIFGVHFDYKSGKLFLQDELRISRQASNKIPGESLPFEAVNSIYSGLHNAVSPSEGKYVVLQQSKLEEDFGQSTLPLFDATPIAIDLPSALNGIGIFHKGAEGYAGFISLRVFGIKYEKYFEDFKFSHMKNVRVSFNDSNNH